MVGNTRSRSADYTWANSLGLAWRIKRQQIDNYNSLSATTKLSVPLTSVKRAVELQLGYNKCLSCCMGVSLSFPRIRVRNVVARNSTIIDACERGDALLVRQLLERKEAHLNDTTAGNKTLLAVWTG